jgi:hypothetical protein
MENVQMKFLLAATLVLALASGAASAQYMAHPYGNSTILMPQSSGQTLGYPNATRAPGPTYIIPNAQLQPAAPRQNCPRTFGGNYGICY